MVKEIRPLYETIGRIYEKRGVADMMAQPETTKGRAFYRLRKDPTKVVCVSGYVWDQGGPPNARIFVNIKDHDSMIERRRAGDRVGEERGVTTKWLLDGGATIDYSAMELEELLGRAIPELRNN